MSRMLYEVVNYLMCNHTKIIELLTDKLKRACNSPTRVKCSDMKYIVNYIINFNSFNLFKIL
jgi:hemerythrin-like domain-containing protein